MSKKRALRAAERLRCIRSAERIIQQFEGMGFRHNADKADGARAVLDALRGPFQEPPHEIVHVCGLTPVTENY